MKDPMLSWKKFSLFMYIIFIIFCVSIIPALSEKASNTTSNGLVLNLIPHDLIYPPTYPPNSTLSERIDLALSRVLPNGRSHVIPGHYTFYVRFKIGSKKTTQIAGLDTGSGMIWIQCKRGKDPPETGNQVYDHTDSKWFKNSTCRKNWYCNANTVPNSGCDKNGRCKYNISYVDGSYSKGFVGIENLTFESVDSGTYTINDVLFGCGIDNLDKNKREDGVFGIAGAISIVRQTNNKSSFCFGGIDEISSPSHLALGDKAIFPGDPVNFFPKRSGYFVTLKNIVFGQHGRIHMSPVQVMVDTGATFTSMTNDIYIQIREKVKTIIGEKMKRFNSKVVEKGLCYEASKPIPKFPIVTMNFSKKSAFHMDFKGVFWKVPNENAYCLAFQSSDKNAIGAVNMQFHNLAFDLNTKLARFNKAPNCNQLK